MGTRFARIVIGIALNGFALYVVTYFLDSVNYRGGIWFFVVGGIVIGLLNTIVKPALKLITLPFIVLSGGLVLIIINTIILWLAKEIIDTIQIGEIVFEIEGTVSYLVSGLLFGIVNWLEHLIVRNK